MKKLTLLLIAFILIGCQTQEKKFSESFLSFDTYIELTGYTKNQSEFDRYLKQATNDFETYHQLFDAYNNYDNINNVKTINDNAGIKPVKVNKELYKIIEDSINYNKITQHKNKISLAPVVLEYKKVQDNYDNNIKVSNPAISLLEKRAACSNINDIQLNKTNSTIYLKNKCNKIDLGSVAKGYTANKVALKLKDTGFKSGILNAGGNVVLIGSKDNNKPFSIGIADPNNPETYKVIIKEKDINIVTSGDYQRYYIVDGVKMNHIIDPDTLKPANVNKSVSIISNDGFLADYFSTECFMLNEAQIKKLAQQFNFEYIIIDRQDKISVSEGLSDDVEIK